MEQLMERQKIITKNKLANVTDWVFDLDDTLYPSTCDVFFKMEKRICEYMSKHIGITVDEARVLQREYYAKYGVTIRGLMIHHNIDPDDFLEDIHQIDLSVLPENKDLDECIANLPGKKYIFTNGIKSHAERVLKKVGIRNHFEGIFSIREAHFVPKPSIDIYKKMLNTFGIDPTKSIMFDDAQKNLRPANELGMATVWVRGAVTHFSKVEENPEFCDYITSDITSWLKDVLAGKIK
ncbi:MAG: D-glucose-1-phosphatase [Alphaproteobacteria bacterium ADurb.Bin438]|nr:MAG: D-glucose-1-phosphatase [Alphaproteobacteria bacterium ADurb.Bin438]